LLICHAHNDIHILDNIRIHHHTFLTISNNERPWTSFVSLVQQPAEVVLAEVAVKQEVVHWALVATEVHALAEVVVAIMVVVEELIALTRIQEEEEAVMLEE